MTVSVQTPYNSSTGNGVTTVFAYSFKILSADDLKVTVDGVLQTISTHYTVSGVGGAGGNVTFLTAPANGAIVVRYSDTQMKRDTDYQQNGDFLESVVDADFDRLWLGLRDTTSKADRALRAPPGETLADLPVATARASKLMGFDSDGDPALYVEADFSATTVTAFAATLLDDGTAADARATLGAPAAANGAHTGATTFQNVAVATSFTSAGFTAFDVDAIGAFNTNGWNVTTQGASAGGVVAFHNSATASNGFSLYRSRGTSAVATDSQAGDVLGVFRASGWNLGTWRTAGVVRVDQEAYSAGVGYTTGTIRFFNVDYSGAEVENLRIWGSGAVALAGETPPSGYNSRGDLTLPAARSVRAKNTVKAWVNFNGTDVVAIASSSNVSSITDNGLGDYTVNFVNALSDALFSASGNCSGIGGNCFVQIVALTTASLRIYTIDRNTAFSNRDQNIVTAIVLGNG